MNSSFWDAPGLLSLHRLPMHTLDRRGRGRGTVIDLSGPWRFQLLPDPAAPLGEHWARVQVPGCWTLQDVTLPDGARDLPRYTNVVMPFPDHPPHPPRANPTGVYVREVTIPYGWQGRRVVLQVGAAESVLLVAVDGVPVGMSKDSHLAAEFDLTTTLVPGRPSILELRVVKWSDASFIEDQDQWWHGGLTRDVVLYATSPDHLADVKVTAGLSPLAEGGLLREDGTGDGDLLVDVEVARWLGDITPGWSVTAVVQDRHGGQTALEVDEAWMRDVAEHERVSGWFGRVRLRARIEDVEPWSAEFPELHDLDVELRDASGEVVDSSQHRVGFRRVEVVGRDLLVNGVRIMVRGANRHDADPLTGRVVTREQMIEELTVMKQHGFNAVRTSHYPNDPALLDLCDTLGLYVVDEADIESHANAWELCSDPAYLPAFVDRVSRMVRRDRSHPSVIIWSLGNESDYGASHDAAAAWVRHEDPSRPVQYEGAIKDDWTRGQAASDIICPMYADLPSMVAHARSGTQDRPLILCEYSHAMGNSNGTLAEHWEAFENTPGLQGGFIWELRDHGLLQRVSDGRPAGSLPPGDVPSPPWSDGVAAAGFRWAHGGDFGEQPHDGGFCMDGLLFCDRTPKPAMGEHRRLAAPLALHLVGPTRVAVTNRQQFIDAGWLTGRWVLTCADPAVPERELAVELPSLPPGGSTDLDVPRQLLAGLPPTAERWLALEVTTIIARPWAPVGTPVCTLQVALPVTALRAVPAAAPRTAEVELDDEGLPLHPLLAAPPQLCLWRAPTDNDVYGGMAGRWHDWGLDALSRNVISVERHDEGTVVTAHVTTGAGHVVEHRRTLTRHAGGLHVSEEVSIPDELSDLPRVGTVLELVAGLDTAGWLGRGPGETYPDRRAAGRIGWFEAPTSGWFTPYATPQESGGRSEVRRLRLRGPAGGCDVVLDQPLQVSVGHHRVADLAKATHHDELVAGAAVVVHLDAVHRGLGTSSCGPDTLPQHLVPTGTHRWSWTFETQAFGAGGTT